MPMVAALLPRASFLPRPRPLLPSIASLSGLHVAHLFAPFGPSKPRLHAVLACAAVPFNEFDSKVRPKSHSSKKSPLLSLIEEIEPMDVSHIQKDAPPKHSGCNEKDYFKHAGSSSIQSIYCGS